MGSMVLAGIMRRIAEHHRYVTSGFPDLTVWNPDTGKFKAGTYVIFNVIVFGSTDFDLHILLYYYYYYVNIVKNILSCYANKHSVISVIICG